MEGGHPASFVGTMTGEAVLGQNRPNVPIELDDWRECDARSALYLLNWAGTDVQSKGRDIHDRRDPADDWPGAGPLRKENLHRRLEFMDRRSGNASIPCESGLRTWWSQYAKRG